MFTCPRRIENAISGVINKDKWSIEHICSYCGGISSGRFLWAVEAGHKIVPTDKNYKAYVNLPNLQYGETIEIGSSSGPVFRKNAKGELVKSLYAPEDITDEEMINNFYKRPFFGKASQFNTFKFYFHHLSLEEQGKFVKLFEDSKFNFAYPGKFYVKPFFMG
jgi:hypothetical protein